MMYSGDEQYSDEITSGLEDEPLPVVDCRICGVTHMVPECKWNTAPTDEDVRF